MLEITLFSARVLAGVLAGVYVGFAVAVMPALRRSGDAAFVEVMNHVSVVIVNPAFLLAFLGAPASAVALLVFERSPATVSAAVLGVVALVVTAAVNIPLNNALAAGGTRRAFEAPWNRWHLVRSVAALASFVLLCAAA